MRKKSTNFKENVGKFLLDLSKLLFGSFILGGMLRGQIPQYMILIIGASGFTLFCVLGLALTTKNEEPKDKR